jgi:hypothetical protein
VEQFVDQFASGGCEHVPVLGAAGGVPASGASGAGDGVVGGQGPQRGNELTTGRPGCPAQPVQGVGPLVENGQHLGDPGPANQRRHHRIQPGTGRARRLVRAWGCSHHVLIPPVSSEDLSGS